MFLVGTCHFDDSESATGGWASINGEKAFRINGYNELQTDVLWITNLPYRAYQNLRLYSVPHIYDRQYFRTTYDSILFENGIKDPVKGVVFASKVYTRIANFAISKLGINLSPAGYRFTALLGDVLMPSFMTLKIPGVDGLEISEGIRQSTQELQKMTSRTPKDSTSYNFVFPRGAYSSWLLSQPYPGPGLWDKINDKDVKAKLGHENRVKIKGTDGILEKYIELGENHAVFLKVKVLSQEADFAGFQTFGAGSNYIRNWATLPEIIYLSKFSKIQVLGGYKIPLKQLSLIKNLNLDKREFSYSKGILLENIYMSLAQNLHGDKTKKTAVGAYIRSYDRIACGRMAEIFTDSGLTVGSFGAGKVTLFLRPTQLKKAAKLALANGMLPPIDSIIGD